jgi:hypothetical protein
MTATLVGIIAGIPAALALSRWQQASADRASEAKKGEDAATLERRLTRVLREEFVENVETAKAWRKTLLAQEAFMRGFSIERWQVLKESGELGRVGDLDLLGDLARIHELYSTFNFIHERLMQVLWFVGLDVAAPGGKSTKQIRKEGIEQTMLALLNEIDGAHTALSKRLPPTG